MSIARSTVPPLSFTATSSAPTSCLKPRANTGVASAKSAKAQFRFHHISTDEVFGALKPDAPPFNEATAYDPRSPYAASKASSDHLVRAWHHTYGLPTLVSNTTNNYGPWQFPGKADSAGHAQRARRQEPARIRRRFPNAGLDLCRGSCRGVGSSRGTRHSPAAPIALGHGSRDRNIDVVRTICAVLDELVPDPAGPRDRLIQFVEDRPGHDFRYEIDPSAAEAALGWRASHDFARGIRETVEWYLHHRPWWQGIRAQRYAGQRLGIGPSP